MAKRWILDKYILNTISEGIATTVFDIERRLCSIGKTYYSAATIYAMLEFLSKAGYFTKSVENVKYYGLVWCYTRTDKREA